MNGYININENDPHTHSESHERSPGAEHSAELIEHRVEFILQLL